MVQELAHTGLISKPASGEATYWLKAMVVISAFSA